MNIFENVEFFDEFHTFGADVLRFCKFATIKIRNDKGQHEKVEVAQMMLYDHFRDPCAYYSLDGHFIKAINKKVAYHFEWRDKEELNISHKAVRKNIFSDKILTLCTDNKSCVMNILEHRKFGDIFETESPNTHVFIIKYVVSLIDGVETDVVKVAIRVFDKVVGSALYTLDGHFLKSLDNIPPDSRNNLRIKGVESNQDDIDNKNDVINLDYNELCQKVCQECSVEQVLDSAESFIDSEQMRSFLFACLGYDIE